MKIEVKNLVRHFKKTKAVDNISFSFSSGNIFGFIGPNGAGKTTTIRVMATLDYPDSGDVLYDGVSAIEDPEKIRKILGYMPDSLPMHKDIRVWEYLDFFARAYGIKNPGRAKTLKSIEEFTNLGALRDKFLHELSKGMRQRVSLARALIHNPEVLIMDEPAAGLDPRARIELRELLKILASQKKAILISSHILSELEDICDGAVIIEKGKLLRSGSLEELRKGIDLSQNKTLVEIRIKDFEGDILKHLLQMPYVKDAKITSKERILAEIEGNDDECAEFLKTLINSGCKVVDFRQQKENLEELFMNITKGDVQ